MIKTILAPEKPPLTGLEAASVITAGLFARYGATMPQALIDDVLSGTSQQLPRNADGSVSVADYTEWHIALGEAMERELQADERTSPRRGAL